MFYSIFVVFSFFFYSIWPLISGYGLYFFSSNYFTRYSSLSTAAKSDKSIFFFRLLIFGVSKFMESAITAILIPFKFIDRQKNINSWRFLH